MHHEVDSQPRLPETLQAAGLQWLSWSVSDREWDEFGRITQWLELRFGLARSMPPRMLAVFMFGSLGRAVVGRINDSNGQISVRGLLAKKREMKRTWVKSWTEQLESRRRAKTYYKTKNMM